MLSEKQARKRILAHILIVSKPEKLPVKGPMQKRTKLSKQQVEKWRKLSIRQQKEYLKAHPKSKFHKVGLNKPKGVKKGYNPLGIKIRKRNQEEINKHMARMRQIKADKAMERNSKEREMSAALIEKNGPGIIKESLDSTQQKEIQAQYNEIKDAAVKQGSDPKPAEDRTDSIPKEAPTKPASEEKTPSEDKPKPPGRKLRKFSTLAYTAGALGVAALLGAAVFTINPAVAMYLGYHFLDKLPDMLNSVINSTQASVDSDDSSAVDSDIEELLAMLADYIRAGDLPHDILEVLEKDLSAENE